MVENGGGGVQKPLVAGQGKTVPGAVLLAAVGRSVPGGGKSRKRTAAGGRPLTLGCAGGAVGSVQGLSQRVETLTSMPPMRSMK